MKFANDESKEIYQEIKASLAEGGDTELLGYLETIESDVSITEIDLAPGGFRRFRAWMRNSAYTTSTFRDGVYNRGTVVVGNKIGYSKASRFFNEIGHVYFYINNRFDPAQEASYLMNSEAFSIDTENIYRSFVGCDARPPSGLVPTCNR